MTRFLKVFGHTERRVPVGVVALCEIWPARSDRALARWRRRKWIWREFDAGMKEQRGANSVSKASLAL